MMLRSLLRQIAAQVRRLAAIGRSDPAELREALASGDASWKAGDRQSARGRFTRVLALEPDNVTAHYVLGVIDAQDGDLAGAAARLTRLLAEHPDHVEAWNALGNVNKLQRRWEDAVACYRRALEGDPRLASALSNLGICLRNQGSDDEAMDCLARAAALAPTDSEILFNHYLGMIDTGREEEGERGLLHVLERDPQHAEAHVALACQLLVAGRFSEGWREYEWRSRTESWERRNAEYPYPWWQGEPLRRRRLLVRAEQGLGDQIMFASCLPDLIARDGSLIVECEPRLAPLYARSFPGCAVHAQPAAGAARWTGTGPAPELQVNIGSLPLLLGRGADAFLARGGYLVADPAKVQAWRERLASLGAGLKVGVSWRGGTWNTRRLARSIPLGDLAPVLRAGPAHFVSVQYGDCAGELAELERREGLRLHHWPLALDDYDETAALVAALDLVVSVQTTVVHLAGALATPAWAMVPVRPEWRYLREGNAMPWYPSVRLIRQQCAGNWANVVDRVAAELPAFAGHVRSH